MLKKIKDTIKTELDKMSKNEKIVIAVGLCFSMLFFIGCITSTPPEQPVNENTPQAITSNATEEDKDTSKNILESKTDKSEENTSSTHDDSTEPVDANVENEQNTETYNEPVQVNEETPNYTEPTQTYTEPVQEPVQETTNTEETVWIGETGTKYHRYSCSTLRGNKYEITLQEAINQGRGPCKRCKP